MVIIIIFIIIIIPKSKYFVAIPKNLKRNFFEKKKNAHNRPNMDHIAALAGAFGVREERKSLRVPVF